MAVSDLISKYDQKLLDAFRSDHALPVVLKTIDDELLKSPLQESATRLINKRIKQEQQLVWIASDYVAETCIRHPAQFLDLCASGDLHSQYSESSYLEKLQALLKLCDGRDDFARQIRLFRNREMVRIIWRDICDLSSLEETVTDLSNLADGCINISLNYLHESLAKEWGEPYGSDSGKLQRMIVMGMGKLGARELNLSSDIDLIFTYPETGKTKGGKSERTTQEFFIRLSQQLIKILDEVTAEGFVFRVDMRLRPYGQSGALVSNFDALESYYEEQGRMWERYAMVKYRAISGSPEDIDDLRGRLLPFIYRRYIDFGVFDSLREMKALINREVRRKNADDNVKIGPGGIREIEFIAQSFQLIRGGKISGLQEKNLLKVLDVFTVENIMPDEAIEELKSAYYFLRHTEHRIQALKDRQTQQLPMDEFEKERLALSMKQDSWNDFYQVLNQHKIKVRKHFEKIVVSEHEDEASRQDKRLSQLWIQAGDKEDIKSIKEADDILSAYKLDESEFVQIFTLLKNLKSSRQYQTMQAIGRDRLDRLMPILVENILLEQAPAELLKRLQNIMLGIMRRSVYISLLLENRNALKRLTGLCGASLWIAEEIGKQPLLLDELVDDVALFDLPGVTGLADELRQQLLRIPEEDLEQQMECLRQFKKGHVLKVAASEITEALPLMRVSDYLTDIAETVLQEVLPLAWDQLVLKYGYPSGPEGDITQAELIIVGYGKLGGLELSYGSDLDMVFLYNAYSGVTSNPERSIDNQAFYTRLGQRMIHILTAKTPSGDLYEVDMRLRPSGNSGLLVSSLSAFEKYQKEKAWMWEHQALVRARVVSGHLKLAERFDAIRADILGLPREAKDLKEAVVDMREKMVEEFAKDNDKVFDIKHSRGGIVDIEFMVQYTVLNTAGKIPEFIQYPDNVRLLELFADHGLMDRPVAKRLREIYIEYRSAVHRFALLNNKPLDKSGQFDSQQKFVRTVWQEMML